MRCNLCGGAGRYHHPTCAKYLDTECRCTCGMPACPMCPRVDPMLVVGAVVLGIAVAALVFVLLAG